MVCGQGEGSLWRQNVEPSTSTDHARQCPAGAKHRAPADARPPAGPGARENPRDIECKREHPAAHASCNRVARNLGATDFAFLNKRTLSL